MGAASAAHKPRERSDRITIMTCYKPITFYRSRSGINPETGKWPLVYNLRDGYIDKKVEVPCGRCIGCRIDRSRTWAVRCMHESVMHKENCYVTLTYNDENLPKDGSLKKKHLQNFWKRLRKNYQLRYYACGEYGDETYRPHYHAIIFGMDFKDKRLYKHDRGNNLFISDELEKTWSFGNCIVGNVTYESCAYVARYVMKKALGKNSKDRYLKIDEEGEVVGEIEPEFSTMSLRPAIGLEFLKKYKNDMYDGTRGTCVIRNGVRVKTPKYYDDKLLKKELEILKRERRTKSFLKKEDNEFERQDVRETVKKAQLSLLKRKLR